MLAALLLRVEDISFNRKFPAADRVVERETVNHEGAMQCSSFRSSWRDILRVYFPSVPRRG